MTWENVNGIYINSDPRLEDEAEEMERQALAIKELNTMVKEIGNEHQPTESRI